MAFPVTESYVLKTQDEVHVTAHSRVSSSDDFKSPGSFHSAKDRDDQNLARFGKKQVLKRNFGFMSILGFSCTLMVTWEGLFCAFIYGLQDGGSAGLIYGYLFCWVGYFAVVASLAEMASMIPTAGGQYHWTHILAPAAWKDFMSYITGWQSTLAWQAGTASAAYLAATVIQGLIVLNVPDYVFKLWHGTLLLFAIILLALLFNTLLAPLLPKVEATILMLHIFGFFAVIITLTYFGPHAEPSSVFTDFSTLGGYSQSLAFFIGLISTVFAFIGADGAVHMSEEIQNAATVVPHSLMVSIGINGVLGFAMLIATLFCMGNLDKAFHTPTKYPFLEIFKQATQSTVGATIMASLIVSLMTFATIALLAATSRQMWAFARDNGLPGSRYLSKVQESRKLPMTALFVSTAITMLLGLINVGSAVAFNAIASLVVSGFLTSYILPISLLLWHRTRRHNDLQFGPFRLGRWGPLVNGFSLFWIFLVTIFSFFPANIIDLDAESMNWSCLLWGATMLFGTIYYAVYQRHHYHGPIREVAAPELAYEA